MSTQKKLITLCLATVFTLGLAACGGGGSDAPPASGMMDDVGASLKGKYIPSGTTITGVDAPDVTLTAASGESVDLPGLGTVECASTDGCSGTVADGVLTITGDLKIVSVDPALDSETATVLAGLAVDMLPDPAVGQREAISSAIAAAMTAVDAVADDSTAEVVEAAENAIAAANAAIAEAGDILASEAAVERGKVAELQTSLDEAKTSRMVKMDADAEERQAAMEAEARRTEQLAAINMAIEAARTAVGMVNDESTQQQVDDAKAAVANANAKIAEAADVSDDMKATHMASVTTIETSLTNAETSWQTAQAASQELANQRMDISNAIVAARTAVAAVNDDSTDEEVEAATEAIADARVVIAGATDVPAEEKAANTETVGEIMAQLDTAKTARMAAQDAADDEQRMADAAMAATALKLHGGISAPGDTRSAAYGAGDNADDIAVTIGDATPVNLSEDEDAMIADNHGWEGKRYTRTMPASEGMYEAVVYSNVEAPTEGKKFGSAEEVPNDDYEYQLDNGAFAAFAAANVSSSSFDHSAGVKEFELPDNTVALMISGSYHGVSGSYSCTPDTDSTCAAQVAAEGFTLGGTADTDNAFTPGGGAWTFTPNSAEARVKDAADIAYASYGWWLHKEANDGDFTASAFVDELGDVPAAENINDLNGTATYVGGAAGKYALTSSTGGTNDAGHFTAMATLEADFTNNTNTDSGITGTIDMFVGADGQSRDWEVELMGSAISDIGVIGNSDATGGTAWTIGDTAADGSGQWSGSLWNNGDDGVPKVATGTFYTQYGTAGKMVGGFGATKQ